MKRYLDDIKQLYNDYYSPMRVLSTELDNILTTQMQTGVASVDFDPSTKDLPYAHFDAEKFLESNQRVIDFQNQI